MRRAVRAAALLALAAAAPPRTVLLGTPDKWHDVAFDPATRQVFVTHGTEVTVVDAATLRVAGHVTGLGGAHGIALGPNGRAYVSSNKAKTVSMFDTGSLRVLQSAAADADTAEVVYDPASRHVFAMNDDAGTVTIVDGASGRGAGTIALGGGEGVGGAAADGAGHLFISHAASGEVVRLDTQRGVIDARWKLPGCATPLGMAMDVAARRVFVGCDEGRLLVLDCDTGRVAGSVKLGAGASAVLFDPARQRIYVLHVGGTASVIHVEGPESFVVGQELPTAPGVRTGAIDTATGRIYAVTAEVSGMVPLRRPHAAPGFDFVPGRVKLLVLDPPA